MIAPSVLVAAGLFNAVVASPYKYIALFSIDGLHGSDVPKYVALRPQSTISKLLKTGYEYTNAYTSAPSDSFPGSMNYATRASPRTTGIWYDDTFDHAYFDPFSTSGKNCSGTPGAEVTYDESKDFNSTKLFSGGIDPQNLPQTIMDGKCVYVYPHIRLRVPTVFEIAVEAGLVTAYTDKHPAYDIVRGPSGKGLTTGYFPEIAAVGPSVDETIAYDTLHVEAFLKWIDGKVPEHSEGSLPSTPHLFGGNFQAVSVAQKTVGYIPKTLDFSSNLTEALDFIDASLGKVVAALKAKEIYEDTLIIIASKHGQAPIDISKPRYVATDSILNATGVETLFVTTDDIALVFLKNHADTDAAVHNLNKVRVTLGIQSIIYGPELIAQGFGDPLNDTAVPDIIIQAQVVEGVIYTSVTATKVAEHGGLNEDDRHVACFVSNPKLKATKKPCEVSTRQVAPTILKALGLDESKLLGAVAEGTKPLDGF